MTDLTLHTTRTCCTNVEWSLPVNGSKGARYTVRYGRLPRGSATLYGYTCTCKGFQYRGFCKHIEAVEKRRCGWNATLEPVDPRTLPRGLDGTPMCPECGSPTVPIDIAV